MAELIRAQADTRPDEILPRYGVPVEITAFCGLANTASNGPFFEPATEGRPSIIVPVMEGGELADLVAFDPRQPNRWQVRLGACPLLGIDNLGVYTEPLCIWRSPLGYLQAGLTGVVVLSWPGSIPLIGYTCEIVAEDVQHGQEVRNRLSRPRSLPKISVPLSKVA